MPKLQKLLIQGIRSFSPNKENVIEFISPLTLIVGANGTGKTTIIECLKFATTGDMPPNSRGGAFVYDPKLAKQIDVKAEVRLKFLNHKNENLICTRTIQASVKKSKAEQKTLECSLSKEADDQQSLITSKIADIDKMVPENLGISHSILDNVIFCHQDESVWPIGDPTVMKKKLDDIFSSTKYNKALLGLKASKKEITADLKLKTQQLSFFLKEKLKKDDISKRISIQTEEVERKNFKIKTLSDEIDQISSKLEKMVGECRIFEKLETNHRILRAEYDSCVNFVKNFNCAILKEFDIAEVNKKISKLEKELCELNSSRIEDDFMNVENLRSRVVEQELQNEKSKNMIKDIESKIESLSEEKSSIFSNLCKELACSKNEIKEKIRERAGKMEKDVKEKTEQLNKQREMLLSMKSSQSANSLFIEESRKFIQKYKDLQSQDDMDLSEIHIDYDKQIELEMILDELLDQLSAKQALLTSALSNSDGHFKRKHLTESIENLNNLLQIPSDEYKRRIDCETINQSEICAKLKTLYQLHQRHIALNEHRQIANSKIFNEIVELSNNLENEILRGDLTELFTNSDQKITSQTIIELRNSLPASALEIQTVSDPTLINSEIMKISDKMGTFSSADKIYSNFLKVGTDKNHCPLCVRPFDQDNKKDFENKMKNVLEKIPTNLEDLEKQKSELLNAKHKNEQISLVNNCKIKIKNLLNELSDYEVLYTEEIKELEIQKDKSDRNLRKLSEKYKEALSAESSINKMKDELSEIPEQTEVKDIENEIRELKKAIDLKRQEISEYSKFIKESEIKRKSIQQELENRKVIEKRDSLIKELEQMNVVDLSELEKEVSTLEKIREDSNQELIQFKMVVKMKIRRIEEIKVLLTRLENEKMNLNTKVIDLCGDKTVQFNGQVLNSQDLSSSEKYEELRKIVLNHKDKIIKTAKELENAKYELRIVEENIKLKKNQEKIQILENEFSKFDLQSYKQLKLDIETYEMKKSKLISAESQIRGELKQIVNTIKSLNSELEEYKEINKNYLKCSIEIKVLELSSEDLDKCINGLDKAIVDFHSSKIEEVNRCLKDLWIGTYKGNDIDYIELKSESSDTRAYNYRLVMIKNGVELDMRGRSSAGQKMISSLLFRIALADSFSTGCNIFALDEPTTNLDRENIESLAHTLSAIIKSRRNAQFIVITHDEEFVQLLNREGTEYFYRIDRDSKGNSHIQRHSIYK